MHGFTEPNMPIKISLKMPGNSFSEKAKNAKILLYIMIPIFCIVGISTMIFGSMSRSISCTYNDDSTYDCRITTESIFTRTKFGNYSNIEKVILASKRGSKSTVYQIQLINKNGEQLSYTNTWQSPASSLAKKVDELNKQFYLHKNFSYDFGIEWMLILMSLPFIVIPIIILIVSKYCLNNYIFEEVAPGKYQAVLKAKDIGKMNLTDEQIKALVQQVKGGAELGVQVSESTREKNDREFRDRDVEDLTKQFYEDGK